MAQNKAPLTASQKRSKGYEEIGNVGGVPVFLPLSVSRFIKGIDDATLRKQQHAKYVAQYLETERKRQEGGEIANGPIEPELTDRNNCLIKASGTRNWATFSKAQLEKMFSKEGVALMRAFIKTMPDKAVTSAPVAALAGGDGEDDE